MKYLDLQSWPRQNHFRFFSGFDYPQFSICANVDITVFKHFLHHSHQSFFQSMLYLVSRTANVIPEFRYRIREDQVVIHDKIDLSFTFLAVDDIFNFCTAPYTENFSEFASGLTTAKELTHSRELLDTGPDRDDLLYITSLPWISFTSVMHPIHMHPTDSIPRISWGKYSQNGERVSLPLSIQAHHGLMDGIHAGKFYIQLQQYLDNPATVFKKTAQDS
ncbi:MAG TPA: chloramphenicol acetyltransferase [Patescibacteria group bacterium]|nr:chloramphenicol acetyltransferase [Patescibacteria group bacterium]